MLRKQNPPFPLLVTTHSVGQPLRWTIFRIFHHVDLFVAAFFDVHIVRVFSVAVGRIQVLPFAIRWTWCPRTLSVDSGGRTSTAESTVIGLFRMHRRSGTIRTDLLCQSMLMLLLLLKLVAMLCVGCCKERDKRKPKSSLVFCLTWDITTGIPHSGTPMLPICFPLRGDRKNRKWTLFGRREIIYCHGQLSALAFSFIFGRR